MAEETRRVRPALRVALRIPGPIRKYRVSIPSGPGSFEPLSSQAHMTGIPVELAVEASGLRLDKVD